jgi:hypothetical protein
MRNRKRFLMIFTMLVMMAAFLSAQSTTGNINGIVKNEDGERLSGVDVTAANIKDNAVTTTATGKKGTFRLMALPPSLYQVSFDLEGYQSYVASGIQLSAEQSVTLRIKLKKKE